MHDDHHRHEPEHALERLMFFSDAVFAIAITLLIIEVHVPHLPVTASDREWGAALLHLMPNFLAFILTFLVIGSLWASHHTLFSLVARYSPRLLWPNLLLLMLVAFLPFATAVLGTASISHVPFVFYGVTLLVAALLKAWLTTLALDPQLLDPRVPAWRIAVERRRRWLMPAAASLALAGAFVIPGLSNLAMLLIPVGRRFIPSLRVPGEIDPDRTSA